MQTVDTKAVSAFDHALNDLLQEFPEMRRELHEQLGALAKQEVDAAIASSGLQDTGGHVRHWQEVHIGSGGGYAAVRPQGGQTGANSPGAITNYLENGHNIRPPTGKAGYRPRIRVAYVNGYHFYQTAGSAVEAKAIRLCEQFAANLAKRMEGGG